MPVNKIIKIKSFEIEKQEKQSKNIILQQKRIWVLNISGVIISLKLGKQYLLYEKIIMFWKIYASYKNKIHA